MDFEITHVPENGYFIIKTSGDTLPEDVHSSLKQLFLHQEWEVGTHVLYDNRQENLAHLSSGDIKRISLFFTTHNEMLKRSKVALVMPKDISFGLARMWEIYTEDEASFTTHVFRCIDEARQWIEEG